MAEKRVTASGCGTEYAWQIRTVSYSPVGDEVIPPNTKNTSINVGIGLLLETLSAVLVMIGLWIKSLCLSATVIMLD